MTTHISIFYEPDLEHLLPRLHVSQRNRYVEGLAPELNLTFERLLALFSIQLEIAEKFPLSN